VTCQASDAILAALEANDQDIGVFCPPQRLPKTLRVTHQFEDVFTLIAPAGLSSELQKMSKAKSRMGLLKK
jgi:hypothetical protein